MNVIFVMLTSLIIHISLYIVLSLTADPPSIINQLIRCLNHE